MNGFICREVKKIMLSLSPKLTLPLARERLFHEETHECSLAEDIFEAHAQEEDIPILRSAISQALPDEEANIYRLCNLIDAFGHLAGVGPIPELFEVFVEFGYSHGRGCAAKAISVTSSDLFRERFAFECLWDCESNTRALGAKRVSMENSASKRRVHELASSSWEDKEVLKEARRRTENDKSG